MYELLDLAKILQDVRMTKILLEHSFVNEKIKNQIDHTEKNLIDLEEELSDSQSHDIGDTSDIDVKTIKDAEES